MPIGSDFEVQADGDIRHVSGTTNYTVIEFHRWLGDLMDDAVASGDDLLDITDSTASERSTDNIITLKMPFNVDDEAIKYLYDGSIIQKNGDEIYDGLVVIANAGMHLTLIQNGVVVSPNYWTTGYNADPSNGISHRFMIKVRTGGADIDGRRLIGETSEMGFTFSEFRINGTQRGNNVMALNYATDLNNQTSPATIATWTTITNTEGFRSLDIDGDSVNENYYSEWNRDTYTINQFYERMKWLARRAEMTSSNTADTGNDHAVGNGTIVGQAQSFTNTANPHYLTKVHARLRKVGSPTGNLTAKLYAHSGTFGSSSVPTGAALATSVNFNVANLTTSYSEQEIAFTVPYEMLASTNYVIAFEYTGGDASNYVRVEGKTVGTHAGNRSEKTGAWAASSGSDLWFKAFTSPKLYGMPGELVRGITHEITTDTPTGTFAAVETVTWVSPNGSGKMFAINHTTNPTKMWIQLLTGVAPTDNQVITGSTSGATCQVNVTVTERALSFPWCGASTGSAIIGAYGFGVEPSDLTANDKLFDLTNQPRTPPNNVTFVVGGLVTGEDRVLVTALAYSIDYDGESGGPFTNDETLTFGNGATAKLLVLTDNGSTGNMIVRLLTGSVPPDNSSIAGGTSLATASVMGAPVPTIDVEQMLLNGALTGAAVTSVVVAGAIPSDTPATGSIRILRANGVYTRHDYSAWSGSTFTITSHDFSSNNAANGAGVYISYIDTLATDTTEDFTGVYASDRALFIRVRDGGGTPIKTFETTGTLGSAGGSATAIRTSDT